MWMTLTHNTLVWLWALLLQIFIKTVQGSKQIYTDSSTPLSETTTKINKSESTLHITTDTKHKCHQISLKSTKSLD
jgi:hypothetical protein